jgi:hypothetical protein
MAQAAAQREREQRDRLAALYADRQEQSAQSETSNLGDVALPRRISQRLATHTPASSPGRSSTAAAAAAAAASPAAAAASSGTGTSPAPADFSAAPTSAEKRTSKRAKVIPASASPASASSPSARGSSAATASATDSTEAAVSGTSGTSLAAVDLLTTGATGDGSPQEHTAAPDVAEHQATRRLRSATRQGGVGHDGTGPAAKDGGGKSR